ncbi:MAG: hypothetical protein IT289_13295 [Oligoflexia bacterium]|nr:hypothetical protein [Oligoflexia bacterium]
MKMFFLLAFFYSAIVSAEQLSVYRTQYPQGLATVEKIGLERVNHLRKLLNTNALPPLSFDSKELESLSTERNQSISTNIKVSMRELITNLVRQKEYGKPITFDPSDYAGDIQSKINSSHQAVCNQWAQQKASDGRLNSQVYTQHVLGLMALEAKQEQLPAGRDSSGLAGQINEYILTYEPKVQAPYTALSTLLGQVTQVAVQNGVLDRIVFSNNKGKISITLSLLITQRTGEEEAFVAALECIVSLIEQTDEFKQSNQALEEVAKQREQYVRNFFGGKSRAQAIDLKEAKAKEFMALVKRAQTRLERTKVIQEVIKELSREQVSFLTDIMLRLRRSDVPTATDFKLEAKSNKPLLAIVAERTTTSKANEDFAYYQGLHGELFRLEDRLITERSGDAQIESIIRDLKRSRQ